MLNFFVEKLVIWFAGTPESNRWVYITALFGWSASIALIIGLVATILGWKAAASFGFYLFDFLLVLAFSLDWKKLFKD